MLFYLVHHVIQAQKPNWTESQRNLFTFIFGGTFHVLMYITLQYLARTFQSPYLELLAKFYLFIVLIDAATMAIMYKLYWGRSILNETSDNDGWVLDEKHHRYYRKEKTQTSPTSDNDINTTTRDSKTDISDMIDIGNQNNLQADDRSSVIVISSEVLHEVQSEVLPGYPDTSHSQLENNHNPQDQLLNKDEDGVAKDGVAGDGVVQG